MTYGFEETSNNWPPPNNLPTSYNRTGGLLTGNTNISGFCNIDDTSTKVVLYNHIDYGGECLTVGSPDNGYNVPSYPGESQVNYHISSIYLNPAWISLSPILSHTLTLWDGYNESGNFKVIPNSRPRLGDWNDRVKSVHNALHNDAPWLLEDSYAFEAPFNVNIHVRVANDPDFNAWRVCFDGQNCQENAAPIDELYYTWNTYGVADGNHIISVQYRRTSDNGNWANADYYEVNFYLNPNRQTYAPCGTNVDGARLVSGSDCIIVTTSVADMAPVGWSDRYNLTITAQGYDVLAYDSSDFQGPPYLIRDGQTVNVGGNVSGIELRDPLSDPYVPSVPLGADGNTIVYLPMDEGSGSYVYDQVGSFTGTLSGSASFTTGRFGSAIHQSSSTVGGINFGAQNFGTPWTIEMFVNLASASGDQRLAAQLGGSPNTGNNKWLIGLVGGKFRVWACWTNGCHEGFSLEDVNTDQWYYLMFTYDGSTTAKFYVDGVLQTTLNMDGTMPGGSTTFEIGKSENIYGCNCTIDDFCISDIVREPVGPPAATPTPLPTSTPVPTFTPTATATPIPVYWNGGLIANGSFESVAGGWADAWTKDSTDISVDTSSQGNSGPNSLHFAPTSSNSHAFAALVNVDPSNTYQLSQFVKTTAGSGEFGVYIDEYDSNSDWISGQWLGAAEIDASGTVNFTYIPSSSSVAKASIQYYMTANSIFNAYVDSVRFEENLIVNGSFEVLDSGFADNWTKDASTVSIDGNTSGNDGTNSLFFGYNASNTHAYAAGVPVSSSTDYKLSQYIKASSGSGEFGVYIDEYDSSWNWVSGQWLGAVYGATDDTLVFDYTPTDGDVVYAAIQYYMVGDTSFDVYVDRVSLTVDE